MVARSPTCSGLHLILLIAGLARFVNTLPHDPVSDVKHRPQAGATPVLTTLASDPDLTAFYRLFNSTGGDSGLPGPAFEERFNNPATGVKYTIFAPTNKAIAQIPRPVLDNLIRPSTYELLATILRNHIAPGELSAADLGADEPIRFVGGFSMQVNASWAIHTNPDLPGAASAALGPANLVTDPSTGRPARLHASNGAVFKLDRVLDTFATYFGAADHAGGALPREEASHAPPTTTMADILNTEPDLSQLNALLARLNPDFLARLALASPAPALNARTVYLAPSNAAFALLPPPALHHAAAPSNFGVTSFLLGHGLGRYDPHTARVRSADGLEIAVDGARASNARVHRRICAANGCVWVVDRWLDPIFTL